MKEPAGNKPKVTLEPLEIRQEPKWDLLFGNSVKEGMRTRISLMFLDCAMTP